MEFQWILLPNKPKTRSLLRSIFQPSIGLLFLSLMRDCNQIVKAKVGNGSRENSWRWCKGMWWLSIIYFKTGMLQNAKLHMNKSGGKSTWGSHRTQTEPNNSSRLLFDKRGQTKDVSMSTVLILDHCSWFSAIYIIISCIPNFVGVCNFLVITLMQHKNVVLPLLFLCRLLAELWNTISARLFSVHSPDQFFQPQIFPTSHLLQENQNPVYNLGPLQISRKDSSGMQPCTTAFDTLTTWPWNSVPESRVSSEASLALEHNQAFVSQYVSERVQFSERLMKSGS